MNRGQAAIDATLDGRCCALVSGGDAVIYAMAGLVLEMLALKYLLNFINILILWVNFNGNQDEHNRKESYYAGDN